MRRLRALIKKEFYQIIRDPSSILIAFILPFILLFIFGYGVSLDVNTVKIGIVVEDTSPTAQDLVTSFKNSRFFDVQVSDTREVLEKKLVDGEIRGIVIIPSNFTTLLKNPTDIAPIQVIADGSETNTASFVQNYARGVWANWLQQENISNAGNIGEPVVIQQRFWFNPELKSRNFLLPGSIAIIMTLIGTLLTALVVSREWERGTMEALMATPVSIIEIVLGKLIPYFILGMISMMICVFVSLFLFEVPFRGSFLLLCLVSAVFLILALEQGLIISVTSKNQFVASQWALLTGFLPSYMLSGFIFEISSMPLPIQILTFLIPTKYFIKCLLSLFLVGNVAAIIVPNLIAMLIIAALLFLVMINKTKKRLE